jgi:hypothetical protein
MPNQTRTASRRSSENPTNSPQAPHNADLDAVHVITSPIAGSRAASRRPLSSLQAGVEEAKRPVTAVLLVVELALQRPAPSSARVLAPLPACRRATAASASAASCARARCSAKRAAGQVSDDMTSVTSRYKSQLRGRSQRCDIRWRDLGRVGRVGSSSRRSPLAMTEGRLHEKSAALGRPASGSRAFRSDQW